MSSIRPGWLVALCAALVVGSGWTPWVTTTVNGGGYANAMGGMHGSLRVATNFGAGQLTVLLAAALIVAGAMAARGLSPRAASAAALLISLLIVGAAFWYYQLNVKDAVSPGWGLFVCAGIAVVAVALSVWAVVAALNGRGSRQPYDPGS